VSIGVSVRLCVVVAAVHTVVVTVVVTGGNTHKIKLLT
jgi:hypothetical protein